MAQKLRGPLPIDLDLSGAWQVLFAAVDPTTGAAVSGVKVSNATLVVVTESPAEALASGPFMLVPGPES